MPMKPIQVKANFQLDTSAARAQLQGLQRELSSVTKGATMNLGITEEITKAVQQAQLLQQTLNSATDFRTGSFDLSKFTTAMDQNMMSIEKFRKSLATLGPEGEKVFNNLATTIASAQVPLKRTSQGVQQLMTAFGNTMRWQATSMAMHKVVGTIQQAFNYAQNLDKSLTNIQIVTGHNADYMRNFAIQANKAAQALSASTLEYTNASLIYYQQGLSDKEVVKRAETTLKLAKVTGESASKVSQQMTAVWNNFSNGVDNLERYADVMTALGATTASSSSEIAKGLEKFASVTKTIGLSYDYAASALATVTAQTRQSADSVGTAFKTLFSRLESLNLGETLDDDVTLNKYSEALLKVGVNVMDASGKLKNMDSILDELGGKWDSLNKAQQVALAQTVGGVRNYTSLITLMDNWDKFQTNLVTSQLAEGTLQHQADIYAQSWEAAQQRVKTASQGIYDTLISSDFFKGFNNALAGVLNQINEVGKTLGTGGSIAGISNLLFNLQGDKIAKSIDNTAVNLFSQTTFGQDFYKRQQTEAINALETEFTKTGTQGAIDRKDILTELSRQWQNYNTLGMTKEQAESQQALMMARTTQAKNLMNMSVDLEQAAVRQEMNRRQFQANLIGNLGLDTTQILPFIKDNGLFAENTGLGFSDFLEKNFAKSLSELQGMTGQTSPAKEALTKYLQESVTNIFGTLDKNGVRVSAGNNLFEQILSSQMGSQFKVDDFIKAMYAGPNGGIDTETALKILGNYSISESSMLSAQLQILDKEFNDKYGLLPDNDPNKKAASEIYDSMRKGLTEGTRQYQSDRLQEEADRTNYLKGNTKNPNQSIPLTDKATFGEGAVAVGQMFSSMAMASNSITNFSKQLKDGTANATSLVTTMGSTAMALGQIGSVLGNSKTISALGGMKVSTLGLWGLGIAAAGGLAFAGYKYWKTDTLSERSNRANENQITLSAQAKENQQKYEEFLPVMQQYQTTVDKLISLQQGTSEYTAQLIAANNEARQIIETYDLEAGKHYSYNADTGYTFTAEQINDINKELLKQSNESNTFAILGRSVNTQLENLTAEEQYALIQQRLELQKNLLSGSTYENVQNFEEAYAGYVTDPITEAWFNSTKKAIETGQIQDLAGTNADLEQSRNQRLLESQADFQVALNAIGSNIEGITNEQKLAIIKLGEDTSKGGALDKYQNFLNDLTTTHSGEIQNLTRGDFGALKNENELREAYFNTFGYNAAADATRESMAAEIESKFQSKWLLDLINETAATLNGDYVSDFVNINSKDYATMKDLFNQIESAEMSKETQEVYNTFIQKALTDSVKAQDNLVQAMLNNSQFERQDFLKVASELQTEANLSTTQLENVTNYLNSFTSNFGETAGKAVFDALTNNQTSWNQNYYEALQKISLDNSISALADLTHFTGLGVNADLAEPLTNLRKAILEDIDDRGGLAKTLFTSSDFTKVFDTLSEQYKSTGEITAQNIADLAKKNEIIGDYMTVTGSNEQAIADMMEMISSGNITAEGITPAIEHFVQRATGAAGAQQEALDVVAEQDLSDSITNMDKWAQNIGKAFYVGRTNDVLGDRPVLEGLKMVLTPEDYAEYLRILNTGAYGGTTSSMLSDMKGSMANAYAMLDELEGSKKKKGKGGGGMDTVYKYLAKEGIFDESGIGFDERSGRFTLGKDFGTTFGENKLVTFNSLKDYIIESLMGSEAFGGTYNFQGKGYNRSQAEDMATMMLGSMSASSMGTVLSQSGLIDAAQTFFGEISANGQKQGNYITNEQYDALFNQYADVLALMKMEETTDENGQTTYKLREATKEELANKDYGVSIDQWRDYFTQEAKKVGAAIIGIKGQNLTNKDAKAIGTELAKASQGTLTANKEQETKAIVDAAIAAGVQTYRDYRISYDNWDKEQLYGNQFNKGQSLNYDQLQEFYNNVLGLSTDTLNSHLKEISEQNGGLAFTHKYTDAYGVEHNINSRDYTDTGAFTRAIEQENDFSNIVLQYQRDQWVQQYFNDKTINKGKPSYEGAMEYLREMTKQETEKAQKEASAGTQSEPTTPPEGEEKTPPEGETPTPTIDDLKRQRQVSAENGHWDEVREFDKQIAELEGQQGTGTTAWDKASDAEKAGFVYSNRADAADIYNYWKQHPGMTQAEAYDDVVILGKKPEPPKEIAALTPSENLPGSGPLEGAGPTAAEVAEAAERQRWDNAARAAMEREEKEAQALAEKQTTERNAKIAASMIEVGVGSEEYDRASFTAQMSPSEYKAYSDWVKSGGSGEPADWAQEKETQAKTEEKTTTIEPVSEDYEPPDTPSAAWDILPTADKNKEVAADLGYKQNQVVPTGSPYSEAEITKQQEEATQRTIDLLMQNGYSETLARQIMNGEISPEEAQVAKEEEALQAEEEANMVADAIGEATETSAIETAEIQNTLAENINENLSAMGEAIPGTEEYDKAFASASQYTPTDTAAEKTNDLLTDSLRQEKFIAENTQITAESTTAQLDYMGEEAEAAQTRKAIGQEEEQLVDEEGNPIEMPQGQQPSGGGGNGRDSGDNGSGGGGSGGGGSGGGRSGFAGLLDRLNNAGIGLGQTFKDKDTGIEYRVGQSEDGSTILEDPNTGKEVDYVPAIASGQNNARLLAYASGKEGHIAVTGELGPELRVKSDGSMDVLGKTGREYAWVEPDDKIYTASQSAGILKSNKIPGLEGLAKGINNFLPGYYTGGDAMSNPISSDQGGSGSGGGGGNNSSRSRGGGETADKDSRYDPNTLKIRDILERYYTILQKIDDITRAVEKFAKVADRAWGQDRIKAIEKQTALYQQQYDAQKQYVQQINEYMGTDKNALTTMIREFVDSYNEGKEDADKLTWTGAQFDSNGVLTNYREFVEKLVEQYNANAEANSMSKEAQYKFQEQLKDIQMYTDTLNLWESETDKLQELANQILDNSLKEITYRVEYELELNADQKRLLDFQDSFIKDDIFRVADHIANMNKEIANTADSLEKTRQGLYDYLGTLAGENMRVGETYDDVALGLATRDEKGVVNTKSYEDIDFKEISNNLDKWLAELREKDAEGAKEVDKILQRNEEGIITNYRDVLNKINALNEQLSHNSINLLLSDAQAFFNQISDLTNNPKWTGLSTEMKDQITNYMDQFIQYIQSMGEEFKDIVESMGDSIKAFGKKIDSEIDEFDYYGDVYKSFGNIVDLTNQHITDITSDFFKVLNSKALDNNINKIEATRRRYDLFTNTLTQVQQQYNAMVDRMNAAQGAEEKAFYQQRVDELKEQLDIANSQMESAHKDFLQSWEDALSKIQENYKDAVEQASKEFEKGFSPLFNTLALLQAQFDREKALGDLYVDNYQKIHDLNKLDRDITASINDTDNLRGKQRLRDLQEEINQLQEDGTELSEYDLDILDKKYKLELARQALEDAKDAKSMVRLARDNNGNWSYVYTANQDDVDKAEQEYEDAIRDMEQANEDYIDNIQDQILNVQQEAQQAILALQPEDFATYEDYLAAVQNIQNSMYQTLDYLRSQMNNAFGNNIWLENYVPNIIQDHGLTDNFDDTTLAGLLVNGDLDQVINNARENFENNLIAPALEAFTKYSQKQQEVYAAAEYNMQDIGQAFSKNMDTLTQKSEQQVNTVMDLANRIEDSYDDTMDAVIQATNDWLDKIKDVVKEYDILLERITELKKIDGEYIEPAKLINGDNAVDTWAEVDRFKNELLNNGTMYLITTDPTTGKEKATKFVAGATETKDFLYNAKVAAAQQEGEIIDIGDDGVDENEYNRVNNYLDTHDKIVWIRYKDSEGEHEKLFTSKEEWEEWYEKHKYVAPADDGGGGNAYSWGTQPFSKSDYNWGGSAGFTWDTGGFTGRWQSADTGMYTGEWSMGSVRRNGRLAWLHQKELVLNAHDTENFLDAIEIVRQLDNLSNWMANGFGDLTMPKVTAESGELEQNVHIEAEFPNVIDHNEIEQAFNNLVNMASQYANRK